MDETAIPLETASTDDVEVLGEMTWAERNAELRSEAVDCDAD